MTFKDRTKVKNEFILDLNMCLEDESGSDGGGDSVLFTGFMAYRICVRINGTVAVLLFICYLLLHVSGKWNCR